MSETTVRSAVALPADSFRPEQLLEVLRPEDVWPEMSPGPSGDALEALLYRSVEDEVPVSGVVRTLTGSEYAPELRPGIALYATHSSHAETTRLLVGTSTDGLALPGASRPVHVVFVLVGRRSLRPDAYLHLLSVATMLAREEDTVEALLGAPNAEAICEELRGRLRKGEEAA